MFQSDSYNNKQARKFLKIKPLGYQELKELLILTSDNSCTVADNFFKENIQRENTEILDYLVRMSADMEDYGDAPLNASYYIKDYPAHQLKVYEDEMINALLNDDRGARSFLAIALGKIKSQRAKEYICNLSKDKERVDNWIFAEASNLYDN